MPDDNQFLKPGPGAVKDSPKINVASNDDAVSSLNEGADLLSSAADLIGDGDIADAADSINEAITLISATLQFLETQIEEQDTE